MSKKKHYLSEFSVNLCTSSWQLISANQLTSGGVMRPEEKEIADQSHIYVVCRRPGLRFDPASFNHSNEKAKGDLLYFVSGQEHRLPFSISFRLLDGATHAAISPYPHRELRTYDVHDNIVRYLPANALSLNEGQHLVRPDLAKLEVLYVGQSFASGNRSAFERLQSHSTLQKILADAAYESPDNEIFVATFKYEPYRVLSIFDGRAKGAISDERDSRRFFSILSRPLKQSQQISLAEAALIRYFEPKYNKIYKSNFPSTKQKVLASCYELDFSGLIVEINTDDLRFQLFSHKIKPAMHHISKIDLFSHSDRAGFFFYTDRDGSVQQSVSTIG
jgi:hypothetical protein